MEYYQYRERINELSREAQTKQTRSILDYAISGLGHLSTIQKGAPNFNNEEHRARIMLKGDLVNIFIKYDGKGGLVLLRETFDNPLIVAAWADFLMAEGITYPTPLSPEFIHETIMSNIEITNRIPDSLIENLFSAHIQKMTERQHEFEDNELPALLSVIDQKITHAIQSGALPVSRSRWQKTKDSTTVIVRDSLRNVDGTEGNANGAIISISPDTSFEQKIHIAIHEFIHRLAGKLLIKTTVIETEDAQPVATEVDYITARGGLLFQGLFYRSPKRQWLNEAVTEDLAMEINGQESSDAYTTERQLLETLVQALGPGSRELLRTVYFERYDVNKASTKRLVRYKQLTQFVNAKLGSNFLNRLEKFLNQQRTETGDLLGTSDGASIAITKWRELGPNFSDYLKKWSEQERELTQLALRIIENTQARYPEAFQALTFYSSDTAYEEIWERYCEVGIPLPSPFPIPSIRKIVLEKLKYNTKRADYRKKFGLQLD